MLKTRRTVISKTDVAALLAAVANVAPAFAAWKGRRVSVVEVAESYELTQYVDDPLVVVLVTLDDMVAGRADAPVYGRNESVTHRAHAGVATVILDRRLNDVRILIPIGEDYHGAIDALALEVLVDAMISRKPAKVIRELVAGTSLHVGMCEIAGALAAARAKADVTKRAPSTIETEAA